MYGLTHRFSADPLANVTPMGACATVLVIDRDPAMLTLVREAIADHHRIVVAADSGEALGLIDAHRPAVIMVDMSMAKAEIATVTVALAACDELDSTPVLMLDPEQPTNAIGLRKRIDEAIRVSRRVYLGGGLRHRMAA
jgi:CheY-like chemotaxis protein